jgi:hypothetical protein
MDNLMFSTKLSVGGRKTLNYPWWIIQNNLSVFHIGKHQIFTMFSLTENHWKTSGKM